MKQEIPTMAAQTATETLKASARRIDWRLFWAGGEELGIAKMLGAGAIVWSLYSIVQLFVNGIVLDETVMPAQIIAGAVHYPLGHPHLIFYPKVFSGMNYVAAALWKLVPNALFLSALRDFLFVFCSAFSAFAAALLLTRRPLWGHLAATLALTETGIRLWGNYPMWIFPDGYSHGHIGLQAAVLIPVLLLAGCWGVGGFLLGILPALHFSMVTVVWPWSLCFLAFSKSRPRGSDRKRLAAALCAGIALCAVLGIVILARTSGVAVATPYDVQSDGGLVYKNFTALTDYHRRPFTFVSLGYLVSFVAFIAIGAMLFREEHSLGDDEGRFRRNCLGWLMFLGGLAWAAVFGSRLLQIVAGTLPEALQIAMPYRLSNIPVLLLIPMTAAAFAALLRNMSTEWRKWGFALLALMVLGTGLLLALEHSPFHWPYQTWVASHLIFAVWGVLFGFDFFARRRVRNGLSPNVLAAGALAASMFLLYRETRAGAFFLIGFVAALILLNGYRWLLLGKTWNWAFREWRASAVLMCGCILTVAAALPGRRINILDRDAPNRERPYMTYSYDDQLNAWLAKNSSTDEMILPVLYPPTGLQAKTGHPVLMEWETVYLLTYMPSLAPTIGAMMHDLYGMDYSGAEAARALAERKRINPELAWASSWKDRPLAEWQSLSRKYNFRLVLSLTSLPLKLPVALQGKTWTLYTIPSTAETGSGAPQSTGRDTSARIATIPSIVPAPGRSVLQSH